MRSLEAFGRGCAFLDYDNDGWQDLLLVSSPAPELYRNQGDGTFQAVTAATGLDRLKGDWKGCAVGDVDGDGWSDLLLTGYRCLALLRNDHGTRWTDQTRAAGLDPKNRNHWGSSAGLMDLDGDSRLDLVLLNYVVFNNQTPQYCELQPGIETGCPPSTYQPEYGELWRNLGGKFQDLTASSGMRETNGKGLVVAFTDLDRDRRPDFYIGNDGTPAELMHNLGGFKFRNEGTQSGVAYGSIPGQAIAAMGADWADYNRDGEMDLAVSAFANEPYSLLKNMGHESFEHAGDAMGISAPTIKSLGFGTNWLDVDNDGWSDLLFANGHVYDQADALDPLSPFRQPLMLFHNEGGQRFTNLVPTLGPELTRPLLGRGTAVGDFDNDGRQDLLVVDFEGAPLLLRNRSEAGHHWLKLDLRARNPNGLAYGARVEATSNGQRWTGQVAPACSYLSSSDPRIHLGLGDQTALERVMIYWPSGRKQELRNLKADRLWRLREGEAPVALNPAP